jgi:hypothetical protein
MARRIKAFALTIALTSSLLLGVVEASAAGGSETADSTATRYCPSVHSKKIRVSKMRKSVILTHVRGKNLAPGQWWGRGKYIRKVQSVKAGARFRATGEAGTGLAGKILAKAEVKFNLTLRAAGKWTKRTAWKLREGVRNSTRRNKLYAFFAGTKKIRGAFRVKGCYWDHTIQEYLWGPWRRGRWRSWTIYYDGGARCGAGYAGIVAQKAMRRVCG